MMTLVNENFSEKIKHRKKPMIFAIGMSGNVGAGSKDLQGVKFKGGNELKVLTASKVRNVNKTHFSDLC